MSRTPVAGSPPRPLATLGGRGHLRYDQQIAEARGLPHEECDAMISITTAAAQKVKGILDQEKESLPQGGLRIYVQGGGCSGFSYGMVLDEAAEEDQILDVDGVKVIVDPMSLRYLEGAEVDYKEDLMGGGFAIKNPNAKSTCGCGQSFQA